ncbi:MAG: hypothetical protein ABIL09_23910, partial [Gemmatimonadota bacterium]
LGWRGVPFASVRQHGGRQGPEGRGDPRLLVGQSRVRGGEHLMSHYLDMTHYVTGEPHDLHGCQVGVATLVTAHLYERLLAFDMGRIDPAGLAAAHPTLADQEARVAAAFGALAPAVLPHTREGHPAPAELRRRLEQVVREWPDLSAALRAIWRSGAEIRRDLVAADCPVTFAELGIGPERARNALLLARFVRARYTILDLLAEVGLLEAWAPEALAAAGVRA